MLDLEALLAPTADQPPCGPDLEYDPQWQELERISQVKPEQQFGDTIIPAEPPDWREVSRRAEELLGRSKDVRSACLLARASTSQEQYAGLVAGLKLVHQLLERYWGEIHPMLDTSDNDDPTMRLNALAVLSDPQGLISEVRNARLFQSRVHGELTVRQLEIVAGKLTAKSGETVPSQSQVDQQLTAVIGADPQLPALTAEAVATTRALARLLDDKVGSDRSTDLKPLLATLVAVDQTVSKVAAALAGVGSVATDDAGGGGGDVAGGGGPAISAASGSIRSRGDVIVLLDRICEFLQRTEPTNPAPLLLQRAKRVMGMNFFEIMNDMAAGGMDQVRTITGVSGDAPVE